VPVLDSQMIRLLLPEPSSSLALRYKLVTNDQNYLILLQYQQKLTRSLPSDEISAFRRKPNIDHIGFDHLTDLRVCNGIKHFYTENKGFKKANIKARKY
jgi:hypothetical protein